MAMRSVPTKVEIIFLGFPELPPINYTSGLATPQDIQTGSEHSSFHVTCGFMSLQGTWFLVEKVSKQRIKQKWTRNNRVGWPQREAEPYRAKPKNAQHQRSIPTTVFCPREFLRLTRKRRCLSPVCFDVHADCNKRVHCKRATPSSEGLIKEIFVLERNKGPPGKEKRTTRNTTLGPTLLQQKNAKYIVVRPV